MINGSGPRVFIKTFLENNLIERARVGFTVNVCMADPLF